MKKATIQNRNRMILKVAFCLFPTVVLFQNCNKTSFTSTGEIGQDESYQAAITRSIEVSPVTDRIENIKPTKAVFVVDDSATMQNSQENLARSISQLSELLQNRDSEIMVVSTTCSNCYIKQSTNTTQNGIQTIEQKGIFNPEWKKFKIEKTMSAEMQSAVLQSLAEHIRQLGMSGSTKETPLKSIAYALEDTNFFKPGDNALIYVITDENDSESQATTEKLELNYLKYKKELRTEKRTILVPAHDAPGYTYRREYYSGSYTSTSTQTTCSGEKDDFGNGQVCQTRTSTRTNPVHAATLAECQSLVSGKPNGTCETSKTTSVKVGDIDADETVASECQEIREIYEDEIKSCTGTTIHVEADDRTEGGEIISTQSEYFLGMTEKSKDLKMAIKSKLESLFAGKYLLAAQVNTEDQNCTMGQGQSVDKTFAQLKTILPQGRLLRTSICEPAAITGQVLQEIATQLTINISNIYKLELDESERILEVYAIRDSSSQLLVQDIDFSYSDGVLTLMNLRSTDFQTLRVGVGIKENWNLVNQKTAAND